MGDWDDLMKTLARAYPQDLVSLVLQNTHFLKNITTELKVRTMHADFLCKAERNGKEIIVHIEFQKSKDVNMGQRTWEYNCAATILEKLPVHSFVIYLVQDEPIFEPPFRIVDDGKVIHTFEYTNIFLWEMPPEMLKQKGMEGLLPLLPLTKGAKLARDTTIHDMITGLRVAGKDDALALGYACIGLVYKSKDDKQAIRRIFAMFESKLEDSWYYQEVIQKGLEKGMQQGIEQGKKQGIDEGVKALRPVLIQVVETRFPELLPLAREEAERSTVPAELSVKVNKLLIVRTLEEARQVLQES